MSYNGHKSLITCIIITCNMSMCFSDDAIKGVHILTFVYFDPEEPFASGASVRELKITTSRVRHSNH